jgi:hypothetical protein
MILMSSIINKLSSISHDLDQSNLAKLTHNLNHLSGVLDSLHLALLDTNPSINGLESTSTFFVRMLESRVIALDNKLRYAQVELNNIIRDIDNLAKTSLGKFTR